MLRQKMPGQNDCRAKRLEGKKMKAKERDAIIAREILTLRRILWEKCCALAFANPSLHSAESVVGRIVQTNFNG
jgi:hypothetical protein